MEKLKKLYKKLVTMLPESARTKIINADKERGDRGVFTKRNSRHGRVIIFFDSFSNNWKFSMNNIKQTFTSGFRVLCSPEEYYSNLDKLSSVPVIVRYRTYKELEKYPFVEWENVSNNKSDYTDEDVMFVFDGADMNNTKKNKYIGPTHIGRHEMDYATNDEMTNVRMVILFQMINCVDFKDEMKDNPLLSEYLKYSEEFKQTHLYLNNPKLQELTTKYGYTVCPVMIQFPKKECSIVYFKDIVNGKVDGDEGREDFNRTFTKINLHHFDRLISGKLNHNHKNVFLGTACGNGIDANLRMIGCSIDNLF
jgi:hypothetical protein